MKNLIVYLIVTLIYLSFTIVYSVLYGLPPFNYGLVIGFPAMYYQFETDNGLQHGTTNVLFNLIINLIISLIIFIIIKIIIRLWKKVMR